MKLNFINVILCYLIISIFISTYLCMEQNEGDSNRLGPMAAIGVATRRMPLKVTYSSSK